MRSEQFDRLYADHAEGLLAFLIYRTSDRALAEDLVADTFERVLGARRRYDPRKASEKTWIYTIALNLMRDGYKRSAAEERALQRAGAPPGLRGDEEEGGIASAETRHELQQAMNALSTEEREAVALRYGADLTLEEVARVLGVPRTTVEGRVYGAMRKLKKDLE